ncbi:MAG: HAMP domain-containing sensor histidine kinase, partial [Chloroflexota bacterium]|nr:HAMP domain-containing sensor histidine kinase [Chloroflexota bacterium]
LGDYAAIALENARLYENVRQANKSKSEFVSLVAHELKQPMTAIRGYADMLHKGTAGPTTDTQEQFVNAIRISAERMQLLVSDLQDVSRMETGQLNLEMRIVDLKSILDIALREIHGQLESKSQTVTANIPENLPKIKADPARLMQIITNLLSNAHKYTLKKGHIRVRVSQQSGYLHCAVADDGIGMLAKEQAKLFTKFFRAEAPGMESVPGTGLGLCIVKSLVELQGGEIKVQSEIGRGSTFTFTIPITSEE